MSKENNVILNIDNDQPNADEEVEIEAFLVTGEEAKNLLAFLRKIGALPASSESPSTQIEAPFIHVCGGVPFGLHSRLRIS